MSSKNAAIITLGIEARRAYEQRQWHVAGERRLDVFDIAVPGENSSTQAFAEREFEHLGGEAFTTVHCLHELAEAALEALRSSMRGDRIDDESMWILQANADLDGEAELSGARSSLARQVLDSLASLLPAEPAVVVPLRRETA